MKVAVVDYGLGNIYSVMAALRAINVISMLDVDGSMIAKCDTALVPGVAAFGAGMTNLQQSGQADALREHFASGKKLVGLCLGAQMFMEGSEETPEVPGLGFVQGSVVSLDQRKCTVPNQGWLRVTQHRTSTNHTPQATLGGEYFYFSHSYRMDVGEDVSTLGTAWAGSELILAVYRAANVLGTQFHPERSGEKGLEYLSSILAH